MGLDAYAGIEPGHRRLRQGRFRLADLRELVNRLPVQVAGMQRIGIDQPQESHSGAREILQHGTAQTAHADDQHAARRQLRLAGGAHFLEQYLPRIIGLHRQTYLDCAGIACSCAWSCVCRGAAAQCSQFTQPESPLR